MSLWKKHIFSQKKWMLLQTVAQVGKRSPFVTLGDEHRHQCYAWRWESAQALLRRVALLDQNAPMENRWIHGHLCHQWTGQRYKQILTSIMTKIFELMTRLKCYRKPKLKSQLLKDSNYVALLNSVTYTTQGNFYVKLRLLNQIVMYDIFLALTHSIPALNNSFGHLFYHA